MSFDIGSSRSNVNSSSTIGQANGNSYNNNGHVINVTVAEAKTGADGLSKTRDQQDQQNPLNGLMALLNPFAMLSMLGGGGGNFLKMG